jgi:hypothetical protein
MTVCEEEFNFSGSSQAAPVYREHQRPARLRPPKMVLDSTWRPDRPRGRGSPNHRKGDPFSSLDCGRLERASTADDRRSDSCIHVKQESLPGDLSLTWLPQWNELGALGEAGARRRRDSSVRSKRAVILEPVQASAQRWNRQSRRLQKWPDPANLQAQRTAAPGWMRVSRWRHKRRACSSSDRHRRTALPHRQWESRSGPPGDPRCRSSSGALASAEARPRARSRA